MFGFCRDLLPALVCQKDGYQLHVKKEIKANEKVIVEGSLICRHGGQEYQITSGVLDVLKRQGELDTLMSREISVRNN